MLRHADALCRDAMRVMLILRDATLMLLFIFDVCWLTLIPAERHYYFFRCHYAGAMR